MLRLRSHLPKVKAHQEKLVKSVLLYRRWQEWILRKMRDETIEYFI